MNERLETIHEQLEPGEEQLLNNFFARHKETVEDNGFTARVLASLPAQQETATASIPATPSLRRWSRWLNIAAAIGCLALLLNMDLFGGVGKWLRSFDPDTLLVQVMLFLHQIPEHLPSMNQLITYSITLIILFGISIENMLLRQR